MIKYIKIFIIPIIFSLIFGMYLNDTKKFYKYKNNDKEIDMIVGIIDENICGNGKVDLLNDKNGHIKTKYFEINCDDGSFTDDKNTNWYEKGVFNTDLTSTDYGLLF